MTFDVLVFTKEHGQYFVKKKKAVKAKNDNLVLNQVYQLDQ